LVSRVRTLYKAGFLHRTSRQKHRLFFVFVFAFISHIKSMPFTFVHPAAILPLRSMFKKTHGATCALVIGSMSPDFAYFLPFIAGGTNSHSLLGVLYFCLPLSMFFYLLWQYLAAPIFSPNAKGFLSSKGWRVKLRHAATIALLLSVGALTHVVWDGFTHKSGWVAQRFPAWQSDFLTLADYPLTGYRLAQHISTLLGLLLLLLHGRKWLQHQAASPRKRALFTKTVGASLAGFVLLLLIFLPDHSIEKSLFLSTIWLIRGLFTAALIALFIARHRLKKV